MSNRYVSLEDAVDMDRRIKECDDMIQQLQLQRTQYSPGLYDCVRCAILERRANLIDAINGRTIKAEV